MSDSLLDEFAIANGLLRSAYSIALREGKDTNWEAFRMQLKNTLEREQEMGFLKGYWEFQAQKIIAGFEDKNSDWERKLDELLDPNR